MTASKPNERLTGTASREEPIGSPPICSRRREPQPRATPFGGPQPIKTVWTHRQQA